MKIAIIGSGISGLGAAYALKKAGHDITVYEKNNYLGGHSRTIDVPVNDTSVSVDTGFIVFNHRNYPHLTALFDHLGVKTEKSDMSFGVNINDGWLQYSSKNIFQRRQNLVRFQYWRMLFDILKFNKYASAYLDKDTDITIDQCLKNLGMGQWFQKYYLQAMGAAIWSCPLDKIANFPAKTFIRFFQNHGLLTVNDHPQWYTVSGGSREYIKKITKNFSHDIKLSSEVKRVTYHDKNRVNLVTDQGEATYDHVIFSCSAPQALKILDNPTEDQKRFLSSFHCQKNKIVVHCDTKFMPSDRSCWASWVYLSNAYEDSSDVVSLSYWMNNLQNLKTEKDIIITLNPKFMPADHLVKDVHYFEHPVFDKSAIDAQDQISEIQGSHNLWFVGAYQRYGFHEDGLLSSVNMLKKMGIDIPWK